MSKATFTKNLQKGPDHKGARTYIMYHGTTMKAARKIKQRGFIRSANGMLGPGVYVSRSFKKAACYPKGAKGQERAVLKLSVCVGIVKKIDRQGHPLQKSWHQAGYNTAWVPPNCGMVKSGCQENCVWDPKRIRVLSIQSNKRESDDEESTDADDNRSMDEDDNGDEDDYESTDADDNRSMDEDDDGDEDDYESTDADDNRSTDEDDDGDEDDYESTDAYDNSSVDEDDDGDDDDDDDVTDTTRMRGEESTDSSDERSSRHSSDTCTGEYVNTDNESPDYADDRSSGHSDDDEASDEEGSKCDESTDVFTEPYASEFSDKDSYESDNYY